jgi:hypothetical protein
VERDVQPPLAGVKPELERDLAAHLRLHLGVELALQDRVVGPGAAGLYRLNDMTYTYMYGCVRGVAETKILSESVTTQ